jgi:hypothetical protein
MYALRLHDFELPAPAGVVEEMNLDEAAAWLAADPRHALILRAGKPGEKPRVRRGRTAVYRAATPGLRDTDAYMVQPYPCPTGDAGGVRQRDARAAVLHGLQPSSHNPGVDDTWWR